jgi:hypothetical protein
VEKWTEEYDKAVANAGGSSDVKAVLKEWRQQTSTTPATVAALDRSVLDNANTVEQVAKYINGKHGINTDGLVDSPMAKGIPIEQSLKGGVDVIRAARAAKEREMDARTAREFGQAVDLAYPKTRAGRAAARQAWDWFMEHSEALGICEVHDYAYRNPKQPDSDKTAWGRGYRCSRGEGTDPKSVKIYDSKENAGTPGGNWLHIELEPELAKDAEALTEAWKALPRPPKL